MREEGPQAVYDITNVYIEYIKYSVLFKVYFKFSNQTCCQEILFAKYLKQKFIFLKKSLFSFLSK